MTAPATLPLIGRMRFKEVSKEKLLAFWRQAADKTGLQIRYGERVETIERVTSGFVVKTTRGSYRCRSVLLAIGRRGTPRKLDVPGEELPKVVYRLVDPEQYRGQHVLVVGGGDSALEAAASIAEEPGTTVTLSYRGEAFGRAKPKNRLRVDAAVRRRCAHHHAAIERQSNRAARMYRSNAKDGSCPSETTPSSSARAASCRPRFSRAWASTSRPSMARPDRSAAFRSIVSFVVLALGEPARWSCAASAPEPVLSLQVESALRAGNFDRAAELLEQRAQGGDVEAQYQLASLYRSGRGVAQDDAAAFRWMKAAAEKGHAKAQFNLAKMYLAGRGVAVDAATGPHVVDEGGRAGPHRSVQAAVGNSEQQRRRPTGLSRLGRHGRARASCNNDVRLATSLNGLAGRNGQPAILDAAWRGQSQALRQLIASGADLKVKDEDGNTPLALAAAGGHRPDPRDSCSMPAPT